MFVTIVNLTNVGPYLRLLSPCLVFGTIKCLILTHINGASTDPGVRVNLPRIWGRLTQVERCHITYTVEPLSNDHPHQRPSLSYDHVSCDEQGVLLVYESLTNDHPSYTTTPM